MEYFESANTPKVIHKNRQGALMILEMAYRNQYVTIPEMAMQIGLTERAIEKNIQKLKEQNLIRRKDGERSGYWELIIHSYNSRT